jgi:phosphomannomutase
MQTIQFGTDGWRAIIGDSFIFANVRRVAKAIASYALQANGSVKGMVVGYDMRFLSPESAALVAEELAAAGVPVALAAAPTPTPALSYAVVARAAAGGVMITASHNPARWNGIKFKASYGGSASPAIMKSLEEHLQEVDSGSGPRAAAKPARIEPIDLVAPYLDRIQQLVSLEPIARAGQRYVLDPMYGAGRGCIARLFREAGIAYKEIHAEHNPLFPGLNPEPIEPHVEELRRAVTEGGFSAGFATDGDADRLGAIDRSGAFIDSHKIFSILLQHLAGDRGQSGEVVKTFSTTMMIDKLARKFHLPLHVTPIGFKYICELMLERDVLIGGEESGGIGVKGHLPERDGILNSLLLAEVMAEKGKTLGELVAGLNHEFGPHEYGRIDLEAPRAAIDSLMQDARDGSIKSVAGRRVTGIDTLDGVKLLMGDAAWLLIRASGTENLLRLYAEAPSTAEVQAMLSEARAMAQTAG